MCNFGERQSILKSVDASDLVKLDCVLPDLFEEILNDVGVQNVLKIVMNNAANVAAG